MGSTADVSLVRRGVINYTVVRGDTFAPPPISFVIDGTPEDFSGSTLKMQIRSDAKREMIELANGTGIAVASNVLQYSIDASDMEEWSCGTYKYDVQKTDGSGIISTIQAGTINLIDDVTK